MVTFLALLCILLAVVAIALHLSHTSIEEDVARAHQALVDVEHQVESFEVRRVLTNVVVDLKKWL